VALAVLEFDACERFYRDLLCMRAIWRPDTDNVYLTTGIDNLALHRRTAGETAELQRLDHIGFAVESAADVDAWHAFLSSRGVPIAAAPRTHRDGSRSLYCLDPDGNKVQLLHEPRWDRA
jgi:catechol 2,3-dioxygenase-like lactoylglutathione lyase family enzyme